MNDTSAVWARMLEVVPLVMRTLGGHLRHAGFDMAPGHLRLLGLLAERPYTLGDLAAVQSVSAPTMSNSITALEERGWVQRVRDTRDRRRVLIEVTAQGCQALEAFKQQVIEAGVQQGPALTEEECRQVLQGLELIYGIFARFEQPPAGDVSCACAE